MKHFFKINIAPKYKTLIAITYDVVMALTAFIFAMSLRYDKIYRINFNNDKQLVILSIIILSHLLSFYLAGLYKGIWRFSSVSDLIRVIRGSVMATSSSFIALFLYNRLSGLPRSVFLIELILLIVLLGGGRLLTRISLDRYFRKNNKSDYEKVIVMGAGRGGEKIAREIHNNPNIKIKITAFADDDPTKLNRYIHNIPILGSSNEILKISKKTGAKKVLIAIPSINGDKLKEIIESCKNSDLAFKILPATKDLINGRIEVSQMRNIQIQDLLGRKPVELDLESMKSMIEGKTIVVTGAGGSIGSELCSQVALLNPEKIILFELSEYSLYSLERELKAKHPHLNYVEVIGDIRNQEKVKSIFEKYKPQIVFHAAAYKHVPMMESNSYESIQTNIRGTKILAEESLKCNVEKFVMISTDKAVNPTNVMGATKRVAEMICQNTFFSNNKTKFITVRFGNVLGSSGSVLPLFQKQLEQGGPITVTDPNIERYFMTIPEATKLVIQAAAMGEGGEIFVLDMGEPVKIVDLAKQLISLSGLKIGKDIDIEFIGLRPGEKLYEELLSTHEKTLETRHPMIKIAMASNVVNDFDQALNEIVKTSPFDEKLINMNRLKLMVPEYTPSTIQV